MTIRDMLEGELREINPSEFYAEMRRLGYDKLLLDYALFGEIIAIILKRHNQALAENARLRALLNAQDEYAHSGAYVPLVKTEFMGDGD